MSKFLDDINLSKEIASIFKNAEDFIWIISPYIHINSKYFSLLKEVLKDESIELVILFGKNESEGKAKGNAHETSHFKSFSVSNTTQPSLESSVFTNKIY